MSLIVAARFDTFEAGENAAAALMRTTGIQPDDIQLFFVNPAGAHDRHPLGGDRFADPEAVKAPVGAVAGAAMVGIAGALIGAGIAFLVADSVLPIIGGAGVGAYIGSLAGAMYALGERRRTGVLARPPAPPERHSGVVLAVHVTSENEKAVAASLRASGGTEVERALGRWVNGKWIDFDPLASPELEEKA